MNGAIGIALLLAGWLGGSLGWPSPAAAQARKVAVQMTWVIGGSHAGFFVAKEKGLYAAKGLDVTINRGFGSGDTIKVVAAGKSEFGLATIPSAIISRGKGAPVIELAVINGKSPESFVSLEEKGIRTIKDVEGKTFGEPAGAATMVMWPAFAKFAGIDISKMNYIAVEAAAKPAAFFGGRMDWTFGFRPGFDEIAILRARREGKKLVFLRWEDLGWKVYGSGIITSDERLRRDPKLVADFLSATLDGYRWAIENPDQALDIVLKANPEVDREAAHLALLFIIDGLLTGAARDHGLGYMEPDRMAFQIDLLSKLTNVPPPKAEEVYSNQFIRKMPFVVSPALEAQLAKIR
jgi:NitT/TauT family transport system substrate-binding protein